MDCLENICFVGQCFLGCLLFIKKVKVSSTNHSKITFIHKKKKKEFSIPKNQKKKRK
jgi:hypothetical protein